MKLSDNRKYLLAVNAFSVMVAFMTHFPEIIALSTTSGDTFPFPQMDWKDVVSEILFTYISLILLYLINELIFRFRSMRKDIGWKQIAGSFAVTWIISSLLGKGFVFLHHSMDIPAIDATLHHYLHPLRDFLISTVVTGSNYLMYQNRKSMQVQIENQQLRAEIIESQYEALKSQLNPHMLFNSLNTLSALIRESSGKAQDYLQEVSRVLRYTLQDNTSHSVTLKEELEFVRSYVYLLQMRYEDNLTFDIQVPPGVCGRKVPPMAVQMLVENAVKHNEISNRKPLCVSIRSNGTTLTVSNPYQPRLNMGTGTGIGLDNLQKRYRLLFQKDIQIQKDGQTFAVTIPLI